MQRLAHDTKTASEDGAAGTSATTFFPAHSLPQLVAAVPHALLHTVAEHAIRHSWHGAPSAYPGGCLPTACTIFAPDKVPALTVADVAGPHWDRAVAARCVVQVLQEPSVEQGLRQALWAAAQDYHNAILTRLDSLAAVDAGGEGAVVVTLCTGGALPSMRLSLRALKRDLFSLPEALFFARVTPRADELVQRERVECPPLEGSHSLLFTTADAEVAEALSRRPPSDIFMPVFFAAVEAKAPPRRPQVPPSKLSVRDKLWILLGEMVRLRYLVAYLLFLERTLHTIRCDGAGPSGVTPPASPVAPAQVVQDAKCIRLVVQFLRSPLHQWLGAATHRHRFLRKVRVRHTASVAAATACGTEEPVGLRYETVQELYTAFSRALKGGSEAGERSTTSASTAPSAATRGAQGAEVTQADRVPTETPDQINAPADAHRSLTESSDLSGADAHLLTAILSRAPVTTKKPASTRKASLCEDQKVALPDASRPAEHQPQSALHEVHGMESASKAERDIPTTRTLEGSTSHRVITLRFYRRKREAVWPFELLRDRSCTSRIMVRLRGTHKDPFHAESVDDTVQGGGGRKGSTAQPTKLSRGALAEALRAFPYVEQVNGAAVTSTEELTHLVRTARRLRIRLREKPPH